VLLQIVLVGSKKPAEPALGIRTALLTLAGTDLSGGTEGAPPKGSEMSRGDILPKHLPKNPPADPHKGGVLHPPGKGSLGSLSTETAPEMPEDDPVIRRVDLPAQSHPKPPLLQPLRQKAHQSAPGEDGAGGSQKGLPPKLFSEIGALLPRRNQKESLLLPKRTKDGIPPYLLYPYIGMQRNPHEHLPSPFPRFLKISFETLTITHSLIHPLWKTRFIVAEENFFRKGKERALFSSFLEPKDCQKHRQKQIILTFSCHATR
jgi:hypothetical protein